MTEVGQSPVAARKLQIAEDVVERAALRFQNGVLHIFGPLPCVPHRFKHLSDGLNDIRVVLNHDARGAMESGFMVWLTMMPGTALRPIVFSRAHIMALHWKLSFP